ncbi:MAG TPA: hypothetical protein VIH07_02340 [Candidatus Humimicrobiaceae bacterium]
MNKSIIKRIGIVIIAIGGVVALIGSIGCANAGYTGANVFEFLKYVGISIVGGLLCWLGGEIINLKSVLK